MSHVFEDSEYLGFLEAQVLPSIVLIKVGGDAIQTGFFVSDRGDICTCFHGLFLRDKEPIEILWQGKPFRASVRKQINQADFALLKILEEDLGGTVTPCLPVDIRSDSQYTHHRAISIGFAGIENRDLTLASRMFTGQLGRKREKGQQQRIEFLDLGVGKGNSGAPIFDLQLFRVVGYVRSVTSQTQRLGDGLSLQHLLQLYPDLLLVWNAAGHKMDEIIASYHASQQRRFQISQLSPGIVLALVSQNNRSEIGSLRMNDAYIPTLYQKRDIQEQVDDFLFGSNKRFLVISGRTGSGKTNLLAHLAETIDYEKTIPLFVNYDHVKELDFLSILSAILNVNRTSMADLVSIFSRMSGRNWLIMLDGFNEWLHASSSSFRSLLTVLNDNFQLYANLKVILGVRSEFLQEKVPNFYFPKSSFSQEFTIDRFIFRDPNSGFPFLDTKFASEHGYSELEQMYNCYYNLASFTTASGNVIGTRPRYTFSQLSTRVRELLQSPVILRFFMIHYHNREIPDFTMRSSFLEEILSPMLPEELNEDLYKEEILIFLMRFAYFSFRSNRGNPCKFSDLIDQPWYNKRILDYLMINNTYLQRRRVEYTAGLVSRNEIGFTSDWIFEYFLALYLWEESRNFSSPEDMFNFWAEIQEHSRNINADSHFLGAFLFIGEWAVIRDLEAFRLVLRLINGTQWDSFNVTFTHAFFDLVRTSYTFVQPIETAGQEKFSFPELLDRNRDLFTTLGRKRILDYVEYLERNNESRDALDLLLKTGEEFWLSTPQDIQIRRTVSIGYNHFSSHQVDKALDYIAELDVSRLSDDLMSKHSYVLGRSYQFRQQYDEAILHYQKSVSSRTYFGYRCLHQLAFIEMLAYSNYEKAAELVEKLLDDMGSSFSIEEQCVSRLLHAQCLKELGKYTQAQAHLLEIIDIRSRGRNLQALGKSLGALGEVYLRQFNTTKALETLNNSVDHLAGVSYYLTRSHALDIRAMVQAFLVGNFPAAYQDIGEALETYQQTDHRPGLSWSLQTKALIQAMDNKSGDVAISLKQARDYGISPSQDLREAFITVVAEFVHSRANVKRDNLLRLRDQYTRQHLGWYPGVLSLLIASLDQQLPETNIAALDLFGEDIDASQMIKSSFYNLLS